MMRPRPPFGVGPPARYAAVPHSAPHSPMASHRLITEAMPHFPPPPLPPPRMLMQASNAAAFIPIADSPSPPTSLPPHMEYTAQSPLAGAGASSLPITVDDREAAFYAHHSSVETPTKDHPGDEDEDEDEEEEVPSPPRTFTKAKPLPERENKFTSTLRRLSTVRKRNKNKRKSKEKEMASNGDSGIEAVTTPSSSHDLRPSSTTSRESEAEALTSGYFRYILLHFIKIEVS